MDESKLDRLKDLCPEAADMYEFRDSLGVHLTPKQINAISNLILELGDRVETLEAEYRRLWLAGKGDR